MPQDENDPKFKIQPPDAGGVGHGINTYQACPKCGKTDALEVRDHSLMWHDGKVFCARCDVFVRYYDAG